MIQKEGDKYEKKICGVTVGVCCCGIINGRLQFGTIKQLVGAGIAKENFQCKNESYRVDAKPP